MSHHLTLAQMADVIREQAVEATAERLGTTTQQVTDALRKRDEETLCVFCDCVRAGSAAAQRLHDIGLLAVA